MQVSENTRFLTAADVARILQMHVKSVNRLRREGKLKGIKFNRRTVRYTIDDIREFIAKSVG